MPGRVVAVGLGPAGPDLVTAGTAEAIARIAPRFLRTARHPAATAVGEATTFDAAYEIEATFVDVYARIVDELTAAAGAHGEVLYAVPGSPRVLERTVDLLAARAGAGDLELEVLPALSFLDLAWVRLGIDPLEDGVRLVDGHRFATRAAGERGPLLVAHCHNQRVLSDVKLAVEDPPDAPVIVLQRLGSPDESVTEVPWAELDRAVTADHLTSLFIPELAAPVAAEIVAFDELVHVLRAACPWDRVQTHTTLTSHLVEEAYEVVDAVTAWSDAEGSSAEPAADDHLAEELGDLLYQVVLHATLGAERGAFTLADVARGIHDKLVRRHPHLFVPGETPAFAPGELARSWEEIKRAESGRSSVMDGLPRDLPALLWALKVLGRAEVAGHPWPDDSESTSNRRRSASGPVEATGTEIGTEIGDRLLALVAEARADRVDPEAALRAAAGRVRDQVRATEDP